MKPYPNHGIRAGSQQGAILVGVAACLLGVFALLAVIVEVGAARVAQSKLQGAVDSAAREGLRARDLNEGPSELERRELARAMVSSTFDADLDLQTVNTFLELGAGSIVPLADLSGIGGAGGFDPGAIAVYRPDPAPNMDNEPYGDMVAGTFVPGWPVAENELYERTDFIPASAAGSPTSGAFLVRARRTNNSLGLDSIPGVSSSAPPLPLLFGLGTTLQPLPGGGDVYDPRRDGLTIRATAIADTFPALAVATGPPGRGILECGISASDGATLALALSTDYWITLGAESPMSLEIDAGQIVETSTASVVGTVVAITALTEVGDQLFPVLANEGLDPADATASGSPRAVLLVHSDTPGAVRVVAFGALEIQSATLDGATNTMTIQALRSPDTVASERASVYAPTAWLAMELGGLGEVPGLRAAFEALPGRLLAPVLVR
jgi:hypothetical protein